MPAIDGSELRTFTLFDGAACSAALGANRRVDYRFVALRLAAHAGACTWQGRAAPLGDMVTAIFALVAALASRHAGPGGTDCIVNCVVDLILHCAVA